MPAEQADVLPRGLHRAAGLAGARAGRVHGAGDADDPLIAAREVDLAVALLEGVRPDDPVGIDHRLDDVARRPGGQRDHAAVGLQRAGIGDVGGEALAAGTDHAAGDGVGHDEPDQVVPAHVQCDARAGRQDDGPEIGLYDALVAHAGAQKGRVAVRADVDCPLVHDRGVGVIRVLEEAVIPGQEVRVRDVHGAGGEPTHVDARTGPEQDAAGVDQEEPPVGGEGPIDGARLVAGHAVQGDGGGVGLLETDGFVGRDVEPHPVHDQALGGLIHAHGGGGGGADDGGTGGDRAPFRQGIGGDRRQRAGRQTRGGDSLLPAHPHQGILLRSPPNLPALCFGFTSAHWNPPLTPA